MNFQYRMLILICSRQMAPVCYYK